jgi:hypothetical protein
MIWQTYHTSQFQLNWWTEQNTTHKPITWWNHIRASAYMPIPGLVARGIIQELKLGLKFYCSWTWCFLLFFFPVFYVVVCFFLCYIIMKKIFLLLLLFSFLSFCTSKFTITIFSSLLSPLHSSSFSCAKIHCSPSQLLFLPLLIHSLHLPSPSPILPQPVTRIALPPIHSPPDDQLTVPTLHNPNPSNPWPKYLTLQHKYTQTYTKATNTAATTPLPPLTHPTSHVPFLGHPNQFPKFL